MAEHQQLENHIFKAFCLTRGFSWKKQVLAYLGLLGLVNLSSRNHLLYFVPIYVLLRIRERLPLDVAWHTSVKCAVLICENLSMKTCPIEAPVYQAFPPSCLSDEPAFAEYRTPCNTGKQSVFQVSSLFCSESQSS